MPLAHAPRKNRGSNIPSLLRNSGLTSKKCVYYLPSHLSYIYVNYRSYTEDIFKFFPWVWLDSKSSVLYHIPLMFTRYLDLIKFFFHLQFLSLLCHFSDCAFAAIETEGKKARLRRTDISQPMMLLSLNQLYMDHFWQQFVCLVFSDRDATYSLAWS